VELLRADALQGAGHVAERTQSAFGHGPGDDRGRGDAKGQNGAEQDRELFHELFVRCAILRDLDDVARPSHFMFGRDEREQTVVAAKIDGAWRRRRKNFGRKKRVHSRRLRERVPAGIEHAHPISAAVAGADIF
jgi:hypothetical protein